MKSHPGFEIGRCFTGLAVVSSCVAESKRCLTLGHSMEDFSRLAKPAIIIMTRRNKSEGREIGDMRNAGIREFGKQIHGIDF